MIGVAFGWTQTAAAPRLLSRLPQPFSALFCPFPPCQVEGFVMIGVSKRALCSWLAAALDKVKCGDARVVGIISYGYDFFSMVASYRHMFRSLGGWPILLRFHVEYNITLKILQPQFNRFMSAQKVSSGLYLTPPPNLPSLPRPQELVDAYSYRDRLTMPKLIVSAANDEFFALDDSFSAGGEGGWGNRGGEGGADGERGEWESDGDFQYFIASKLPPSISHRPPLTVHLSPSISHRPSPTVHLPPSISHRPSPTVHLPPSISHHPPLSVHLPPSISHRPSLTVHLSASISHRPSPTVHLSASISHRPSLSVHLPPSISQRPSPTVHLSVHLSPCIFHGSSFTFSPDHWQCTSSHLILPSPPRIPPPCAPWGSYNYWEGLPEPKFLKLLPNIDHMVLHSSQWGYDACMSFFLALLHDTSSCAALPPSSRPSLTWLPPNASSPSSSHQPSSSPPSSSNSTDTSSSSIGRAGLFSLALGGRPAAPPLLLPWTCFPLLTHVLWPKLTWRFDWPSYTIHATSEVKPVAVQAWYGNVGAWTGKTFMGSKRRDFRFILHQGRTGWCSPAAHSKWVLLLRLDGLLWPHGETFTSCSLLPTMWVLLCVMRFAQPQCLAVPPHCLAVPPHCLAVPPHCLAVPPHCLAVPPHCLAVPPHCLAVPPHCLAVPPHCLAVPPHCLAVPPHCLAVPPHCLAVPPHCLAVPPHCLAVPPHCLAVPPHCLAVPPHCLAVPPVHSVLPFQGPAGSYVSRLGKLCVQPIAFFQDKVTPPTRKDDGKWHFSATVSDIPKVGYRALWIQVDYDLPSYDKPFSITTEAMVAPNNYPFEYCDTAKCHNVLV
ncbi:unnamed protein product [Closterium sp. NIES-65]|nr:unnamed protein product [Closterium sp. NIES-65]